MSTPGLSACRKEILELLKRDGGQAAEQIAKQLGVTPMAVRQHLYELMDQRIVSFIEEAGPIGRPKKFWKLTPEADAFFPNGSQELLLGVIETVERVFGKDGMAKVIAERAAAQQKSYAQELEGFPQLEERVQALAAIRTREGYMAQVLPESATIFLLIENHCPICAAARRCQKLCSSELELFQQLFAPQAVVERAEHILQGARRCVYRISAVAS